jgi:O-antigen ligase
VTRRLDLVEAAAFGGAGLFVVCLYTSPATLYPWLAPARPALLGALLMLAGLTLRRLLRGERWSFVGGVGAAMCALYAWAGLSTLWSAAPGESVAFVLEAVKLVAAFVGLATALAAPSRVRVVMLVASLAALVPALGTLQRFRDEVELIEGYRAAWIGLLANPNQLAMVMAVTMPWTLASALARRGALRWLLFGSLGVECACAVVTYSRGGALGMAMGLVAFALFAADRLKAIGLILVAAAAIAVFAPRSFWERTQTIDDYAMDASAQGRLKAWQTGFRAVEEHPLLGIGAGAYGHAWDRHQPRNIRERAYASHNMWMQVLVELGLVGLALFAAMFLLLLAGLWRARRVPDWSAEARALLASFTALVVCGTTGGYAFNWFFYMALGVAGAVVAGSRAPPVREGSHAAGLAVA